MADDFFQGGAADDGQARKVLAIWPAYAPNGIVLHLHLAQEKEHEAKTPCVFLDEDGSVSKFSLEEYAKIYGEELSGAEVEAIQDLVWAEVEEKYRRQLLIAFECGPPDKDLMALYLVACEADGINPFRELVAL